MSRNIILFLLLFFVLAPSIHAEDSSHIEVFHIKKGKVVKEIHVNDEIQKDVEKILAGITDIYRGFEPIPKKGHMVKIPLDPAQQVKNEWFHGLVSEVILIFPEYENPHLLVFSDENSPSFFTFHASVDNIVTTLDLDLKGRRRE